MNYALFQLDSWLLTCPLCKCEALEAPSLDVINMELFSKSSGLRCIKIRKILLSDSYCQLHLT